MRHVFITGVFAIKAIQEQQEIIEKQEQRILHLEERIAKLEQMAGVKHN